jgi:hypothetical protein
MPWLDANSPRLAFSSKLRVAEVRRDGFSGKAPDRECANDEAA